MFQLVLAVDLDSMKILTEDVKHVLLNVRLALVLLLAVDVPLDSPSMDMIALFQLLNYKKSKFQF